jgi:hypothetical protein
MTTWTNISAVSATFQPRTGGETVWDGGETLWDVDANGIAQTQWDVPSTSYAAIAANPTTWAAGS